MIVLRVFAQLSKSIKRLCCWKTCTNRTSLLNVINLIYKIIMRLWLTIKVLCAISVAHMSWATATGLGRLAKWIVLPIRHEPLVVRIPTGRTQQFECDGSWYRQCLSTCKDERKSLYSSWPWIWTRVTGENYAYYKIFIWTYNLCCQMAWGTLENFD